MFAVLNVDFSYGEIKYYLANVIAGKMHLQVDEDCHNIKILDSNVDCRKDSNVVDKADMHLRTKIGQKHLLHTTSIWSLLIAWKNGEEE